jgi:hypothetical protein
MDSAFDRSLKIKPVTVIPFQIRNRSAFIHRNHPSAFDNKDEYLTYYNRQAYRSIEGFWGRDVDPETEEGGWRFMSPNLYFYVNLTKIRLEGEQGAQPTEHPDLRDVDWYISYGILACDGFSGFSDDDRYTSLRAVKKVEDNEPLTVADKVALSTYKNQITDSNGNYKKYMEAREYLYMTHDKPLGRPLYANECLNLILLSTRGLGKSYFVANGIIAYDYIFGRNRTVYDWINRVSSSSTIVGSADKTKMTELMDKAVITISSFEQGIGYCKAVREWDNIDEDDEIGGYFFQPQMGTIDKGLIHNNPTESGKKAKELNANKIAMVTYGQGRHSSGAGFRGKCIIEEAGLLKDFNHVHNENAGTQIQETKSFYSIYIGTGGDIAKIEEIQNAFYNPSAFQCLGYANEFDSISSEIGMFIPAYYVKKRNKDSHGNTIMDQAVQDVYEERLLKLTNSKGSVMSSDSYEGHVRSYPVVPREMFKRMDGGRFRSVRSERRLEVLETGEWSKKVSIGSLSPINNNITEWREDISRELKPIVRYGDEGRMKDLRSAILRYEKPSPNRPRWGSGEPPMYIIAYDPVKFDNGGTSIAAIVVYKVGDKLDPGSIQNNIVAEWYGRYDDTNDIHEIAIRLSHYYSCSVLYENNINEFGKYVKIKYPDTWTNILEPEPILQEKGKFTNKRSGKYGVLVLDTNIPNMEVYYENLMETKIGQDDKIVNNEYISVDSYVVDECLSMRILDEHGGYNRADKTRYDGISACFLIGLWVECYKAKIYRREDPTDTDKSKIYKSYSDLSNKVSSANKANPAFNY